MQMYLDRKKARKLVLEELKKGEKVEEARVVLRGDEFWNSETIWKDGKWKRERTFRCFPDSYWATPTLEIYYKDGKEKRIPCYFDEDDRPKEARRIDKKLKARMIKNMKDIEKLKIIKELRKRIRKSNVEKKEV